MSRPALGPTQPPLQWVLRMLSLTVMQPQHEADHSHSSSVQVKNEWLYTSPPPYALIAGKGTTLSESHAHHGSNKHTNFDILLTVRLSIILAINRLNAQNLLL